jgi:hypothetical protein
MKCPTCGDDTTTIDGMCVICGSSIRIIDDEPSGLEKIEPINLIYPTIMEASMKLNEVIEQQNRIIDYLNQEVKK